VTMSRRKCRAGGRAVAIAVSQSDASGCVATESGGLFAHSMRRELSSIWTHFPTLFAVECGDGFARSNIVIATARDDFATTSGGGIMASQDGGASWNRPADGRLRM